MKRLLVAGAAGLALFGAASAPAQPAPPRPAQLLADANHDGRVSLAEYQVHRRNLLMSLDANKDGRLDRAEWSRGSAAVTEALKADGIDGAGRFGEGEWWAAIDANKDGVVTPAEIDAMTARRFKVFDTNLNGFIDGREPQLAKLGVEGGSVRP